MSKILIAIATAILLAGCAGYMGGNGSITGPIPEYNGPTEWRHVVNRSPKDDSITNLIQVEGEVLVRGGANYSQDFLLQIYPCAKVMANWMFPGENKGKIYIYSDYVNLYGSLGWYRVDDKIPVNQQWESSFGSYHIGPPFGGLVIDHHSAIIERIKRASTVRIGLPYYQGETVVEFDVRGTARELAKVQCR